MKTWNGFEKGINLGGWLSQWDLTDREGNLVADGVYRAYAACQGGKLYGHTPKVDIIVVQQP